MQTLNRNNPNRTWYGFDDIVIHPADFRVVKAGENVALTPRAFDLLWFLLENRGRVVEKREIFESVWQGAFVSDNALTRVIKEIRRTIGDDARDPRYIETVSKRGYRFIANISNDDAPFAIRSVEMGQGRHWTLRKRLIAALAIVLTAIVAIPGLIALSELRSEIVAETAPVDSIAVLAFETENRELEGLSDDLTAGLTNGIAGRPHLRVLPKGAVSYYKGRGEDPQTTGRALGVRAVLTGRVARRGDTVIVDVGLINADRKEQLWGHQFYGDVSDAAALRNEIVRGVGIYLDARNSTGLIVNRR